MRERNTSRWCDDGTIFVNCETILNETYDHCIEYYQDDCAPGEPSVCTTVFNHCGVALDCDTSGGGGG
ncbi:MAG: hypothetical protein ACE5FA_09140 [Dehalococcoidia bacterium]